MLFKKRALAVFAAMCPLILPAQFELGLGAGAFAQMLSLKDEGSGSPYITNDHPVLPLVSLCFRDRAPAIVNLFLEFTWNHRAFFVHFDNSGLGGGTQTDLDVELDHLYFTFGPEWGKGAATFRMGLQVGALVGGSVEGSTEGWSMGTNGSPASGVSADADEYFQGDIHLLFAGRIMWPLAERTVISFEPYLAPPLSSMSGSGNAVRSTDLGLRIAVLRNFKGKGVWRTVRPKPVAPE